MQIVFQITSISYFLNLGAFTKITKSINQTLGRPNSFVFHSCNISIFQESFPILVFFQIATLNILGFKYECIFKESICNFTKEEWQNLDSNTNNALKYKKMSLISLL